MELRKGERCRSWLVLAEWRRWLFRYFLPDIPQFCQRATAHMHMHNTIIIYYDCVIVKIIRMQKYVENNRLLSNLCPGDMYQNIYLQKSYRTTYGISSLLLAVSTKSKSYLIMNQRTMKIKYIGNLQTLLHIQPEIVRRRSKYINNNF